VINMSEKPEAFEPVIVAFCCWWCSYGAADLAGTSKLDYPTNVRIVRVPCSGRVGPMHVLHAFQRGADGVIVAGCLKEQCHYVDGNLRSEKRVLILKRILEDLGLSEKRLEMIFVSAAMAPEFVRLVTDFSNQVRELGPSPLRGIRAVTIIEKREALIEILSTISKITSKEPSLMLPELEYQIFGEPLINEKKCTVCGSCVNVCPEGAIILEEGREKHIVKHYHSFCSVCKKCEEICPEKAIKIINILDLRRLIAKIDKIDRVGNLTKCKICGQFFASEDLMLSLKNKESMHRVSPDLLDICEKCRRKTALTHLEMLTSGVRTISSL